MAKRLLRREHIVAASLVGAVVVVVGFASGLGSRPGADANAAPAPVPSQEQPATAAPTTQPTRGGTTSRAGSGGGGGVAIPVTTATNRPTGTNHTGHPQAPTTTTTPPATSTTPPGTPCEPGLVPEAVDTLLGTLDRATEALGLLGVAPATGLTTVTAVPQLLPDGAPLDQLIATCPAPTTAPTTTTTPPGHN